MAAPKYNRYDDIDFSMFEPRQSSYVKNAARKIETIPPFEKEANNEPKIELVKKPKKTYKQVKQEMHSTAFQSAKIIVISLFLLTMLAALLYSRVQVDELDRQIAATKTNITAAQSENIRLNMQLDSMISLKKVEEYAQMNLGMVKVESHQIEYIDLSGEDSVIVSGNKTKNEDSLSIKEKLMEYIGK